MKNYSYTPFALNNICHLAHIISIVVLFLCISLIASNTCILFVFFYPSVQHLWPLYSVNCATGKLEIFNQYLCLSLLEEPGKYSLYVSEMLTRCSHSSRKCVNCNSNCTENGPCWKQKVGTVYQSIRVTSGEAHVISVTGKCEISSVHVMFPLLGGICNASVISVCVMFLFFISAVQYSGLIFGSGTDISYP